MREPSQIDLETPYDNPGLLFSAHFIQGKGYRTWRPHGTRDWLLTYTLAGKGRFGYGLGELVSREGDVVCVTPHTLHDYGVEPSLEHWEFLWVHFQPRPHWLPLLRLPEVHPGLSHLRVSEHRGLVEKRFSDVNTLLVSGWARREDFAMNALEEVLLLLDSLNADVHRQLDSRVAKAQIYLRQNLQKRITLGQLADACHLSTSRLSHLFREQLKMTPLEFLEVERLERAKRLLELTSFAVQDVSRAVGFDNPFYFTRRFKRYVGVPPQQYRREVQIG